MATIYFSEHYDFLSNYSTLFTNVSDYDNTTWQDTWTSTPTVLYPKIHHRDLAYIAIEIIVAVLTIAGNSLTILSFILYRRLRKNTTIYYVTSLAVADLLVGILGIPFAILTSVGLPRNFNGCIFMNSTLVLLCTVSILCLVTVSADKFWAIIMPLHYHSSATSRRRIYSILLCWLLGTLIGLLPLMGWNEGPPPEPRCYFMEVMDLSYLAFLYFATILAPCILMAVFYARIYCEVRNVVKKMSKQTISMSTSQLPQEVSTDGGSFSMCTQQDRMNEKRRREIRNVKSLVIIILFFAISWIPLYTINTIAYFCNYCVIPETLLNVCIVLSHVNSAVNPLLYAYGYSDFRKAFRSIIMKMLCKRDADYFKNLWNDSVIFSKNIYSDVDTRKQIENVNGSEFIMMKIDSPRAQ